MAFIETMKPRERVLNALTGKPVDRPPVANPTNVATVELMDLVDSKEIMFGGISHHYQQAGRYQKRASCPAHLVGCIC